PEVVGRDAINEAVWRGRPVSESALDSRVRSARAALGDDGRTQRIIRTVHRRGLRFEVRPEVLQPTPTVTAAAIEPPAPPAVPSTDGGQPSIAVLPLVMLGEDLRYGALADAVSHDIIVDLSRLRWLKVIARGSCFRFRGPDVDPLEVHRVLGVRYMVTGSVAIAGDEARLAVELSEPASGEVVWADAFATPLKEL
ncbi:MAG: winged helix-turn-helix domain-containing protein, partial [Planctomycetes bacterium]|nr:winged helix-turn-helix domain-containing protein [Planctomycetota bacterium]